MRSHKKDGFPGNVSGSRRFAFYTLHTLLPIVFYSVLHLEFAVYFIDSTRIGESRVIFFENL